MHWPPTGVKTTCAGSVHCSYDLAWQAPMVGVTPLFLLDLGSVTHRADAGLTSWPALSCSQTWRVLPLQFQSWSCLPFAPPDPAMLRQWPLARTVLSEAMVHRSVPPDTQFSSSTRVPFA